MINLVHGPRDLAGAVISAYRTVTLTVSYRVLQPQLPLLGAGSCAQSMTAAASGDSALQLVTGLSM